MLFILPRASMNALLNILMIGASWAILIEVPQEPVRGLVGHSVLLPVSYWIPQPPPSLHIIWDFQKSIILFSEMRRCLPDPSTPASPLRMCHKFDIVVGKYKPRVRFIPGNASLLLHDLQLNDSGEYTVTFQELNHTKSITLLVDDLEAACNSSADPMLNSKGDGLAESVEDSSFQSMIVRSGCMVLFLFLILGLHCVWYRKVPYVGRSADTADTRLFTSTRLPETFSSFQTPTSIKYSAY
ncbi:uncharacterized protein LOC142488822 isoform X1 [Ascaphus truei]|uniref:uncharacterized protein LOC142488822 isoform X1 n=1 Tax=Ascaphus truei TaxID=8439 RepID=UPI003F5A27C1